MLKLYIQDNNWCGSIVVIAKSEKDARNLMQSQYNYDKNEPVTEHEIKEGFLFSNYGDLLW